MTTLQSLSWRSTSIATLPIHRPRPLLLQQSRRIVMRGGLNFSQNSKVVGSLPRHWYSCRGSRVSLERIGGRKGVSHVCFAAADPPSSPDCSLSPADSPREPAVQEEDPKSLAEVADECCRTPSEGLQVGPCSSFSLRSFRWHHIHNILCSSVP